MQVVTAAGLGGLPAGIVLDYAGATAPAGAVLCYGQAISRTTYAALFAAISTAWGTGDGSTTFNVPDLRGRATFGKDNMGGSAANRVTNGTSGITGTTLGATGGDERLHQHRHTTKGSNSSAGPGAQTVMGISATDFVELTGQSASNAINTAIAETGAGAAQNMPPAAIVNKIITTGGV